MNNTKANILVVDDDILILRLIERLLQQIGHNVKLASNGQEALELADNFAFDMIISDLYMPVMSGIQLFKELRTKYEYKHTPFIFISGDNSKQTWIKNINEGADDFITKPFDKNVFITKINSHLRRSNIQKNSFLHKQSINKKTATIVLISKKEINLLKNHKLIFIDNLDEINNLNFNFDVIVIDKNIEVNENKINKISKLYNDKIIICLNKINYKSDNVYSLYDDDNVQMYNNLNNLLNAILYVKNKYIEELKNASKKTPVKFENYLSLNINKIKIQIIYEPFSQISGGDFYEIINIDSDKRIIFFGDVMGKKWNAWFFVNSYISYIRSTYKFYSNVSPDFVNNPNKLLEIINTTIARDMQLSEVFTTLSIIYIDTKNKILKISSAGALRPLFFDGKKIKELNIVGNLLGILEKSEYQQLEIKFNKNNSILFFTDGYSEAIDGKTNKMIDVNGLKNSFDAFIKSKNNSINYLEQIFVKHNNIVNFTDDRTLLLINKCSI